MREEKNGMNMTSREMKFTKKIAMVLNTGMNMTIIQMGN